MDGPESVNARWRAVPEPGPLQPSDAGRSVCGVPVGGEVGGALAASLVISQFLFRNLMPSEYP